ncbi:hypothetical protein CHARACLAT_025496 [Characodon lateralis]|uniref:Uncharacterized protein n=1 Tax=Characodon lateralis TaxID=208331 RepID=A0ABU7DJR4_9TELE|nr:hypothetical protein [Characodon lateralis]
MVDWEGGNNDTTSASKQTDSRLTKVCRFSHEKNRSSCLTTIRSQCGGVEMKLSNLGNTESIKNGGGGGNIMLRVDLTSYASGCCCTDNKHISLKLPAQLNI